MAKVLFVGDIVNTSREDGVFCSPGMRMVLEGADYVIGNLEAPLSGEYKQTPKMGPSLCQHPSTPKGLREQGFDCVTLANNHIMDYGDDGLRETIDRLQEVQISCLGAGLCMEDAYAPLGVDISGVKIGFINVCEAQFGVLDYYRDNYSAGYAWINHYLVDESIRKLKKEYDFVVVLAHAGLEHYPIPQMEWRCRYRQLCNSGADLVVASHPHCPQGYERWGESLIFYSLGNFFFDALHYKEKRDDSYSVMVDFNENGSVDFRLIYHFKKEGMVALMDQGKVDFSMDHLNSLLHESYNTEWEKMSLDKYRRIKSLMRYCIAPGFARGNILESTRRLVSRILRRSPMIDKDMMLFHLINNESYHNVEKHALSIITRDR
jgi:hypothetical protein